MNEEDDRVVWKGDGEGRFSVKALYSLSEPDCVIPFPIGITWSSWIPSKVSFFT